MPTKGKKDTFEPIRWTIERAASEFQINPRTLAKRIKSLGIIGAEDGKYSTAQICAACFGDYESHRSRKMSADADMAELERDRQKRDLWPAPDVMRAWEEIIMQVKQRVQLVPSKLQSRLSLSAEHARAVEQEVDEALDELSKSPDYDAQSRPEEDALAPEAEAEA